MCEIIAKHQAPLDDAMEKSFMQKKTLLVVIARLFP
jgi:hypothetical protein